MKTSASVAHWNSVTSEWEGSTSCLLGKNNWENAHCHALLEIRDDKSYTIRSKRGWMIYTI